ncbi:MAG: GTP-binding protein [Candidatus Heimdallarchaeota archaeon]|nr:GTP-binding protein [Candidatus Heimdallarchaeota archaeon]
MPLYKICLLGDGGVGKTSLRERFLGKGFQSGYILTIGADFAVQNLPIDGVQYKFQIWDLAGQQRFSAVRALYYKGSHGAILIFDQTRVDSLYNLEKWKEELYTNVGREIPFIILGNKSDLPDSIEQSEVDRFIQKSQSEIKDIPFNIKYLKTSAKSGLNVTEAFETLGLSIKSYIEKYKELNIV